MEKQIGINQDSFHKHKWIVKTWEYYKLSGNEYKEARELICVECGERKNI